MAGGLQSESMVLALFLGTLYHLKNPFAVLERYPSTPVTVF